ncbi:cholesterol 25-hydroxylase-like protein 1, member 2 [Nothobranchius furzeri]|uniref:Member 2 n=3 Tax=Nothobranchius TaxID=28779 RepID=A0A9D2YP31_NOTFU|nr:cholesterol 25-hydroxylase-like protein 1, member 2 [Nothobranchius furzeri]KAF7224444.1 member 2 [Nothobranchius furzeri]
MNGSPKLLRLIDASQSSNSASDFCERMELAHDIAPIWTNYLGKDSVLQPLWDSLRLNYKDYVRSPLFPIAVTVSSYFIFCVPFLVCDLMGDRWPGVQQFKIQPSYRPSASNLLHCAGVTLYNHVFLVLPASVAQWLWRPPVDLPDQAPTLLELIVGVTGNILLFDFQYFIWHLLHHKIRWLYVTFHAIHHKYHSPFALATQCLGGWELVTVGFWTTMNPLILRSHLLTTWAFMVIHVYVSVEDHCGYDFPWSTSRLIPFGIYGGPSKHDVHHQKPNSNFAPHFSHWDKIFGTHAEFSFCKTNN